MNDSQIPKEVKGKTEETPKEEAEEAGAKESLVQVADRLEKANSEAKEILKQQEDLAAKNLLGGTAGLRKEEEVHEETPLEYSKRVMSGKLDEK